MVSFTNRSETHERRGNRIGCLLLLTMLVEGVNATISELPDGLLVTRKQSIKAIATEYTLLVLISEPEYPLSLRRNIVRLKTSIKRAVADKTIGTPDSVAW